MSYTLLALVLEATKTYLLLNYRTCAMVYSCEHRKEAIYFSKSIARSCQYFVKVEKYILGNIIPVSSLICNDYRLTIFENDSDIGHFILIIMLTSQLFIIIALLK